jgi:hypothetical protein
VLAPELAGRLATYSREHAISLPLALIGCVYAALGRIVEADAPTLLVMVEKRDRAELRDLFTNRTAPMRVRLAGEARAPVADVVARVARQLVASYEHSDHLMRHPTLWNDFWAGAPRPLVWAVERLSAHLARRWGLAPSVLAQYAFALVPDRRRRELVAVLNILPEVYEPPRGTIVPRRELPHMLRSGDLVTNTDALLDRTLQIHVTRDAARRIVVNLYGGRLTQEALDEVNDRIVVSLVELVG